MEDLADDMLDVPIGVASSGWLEQTFLPSIESAFGSMLTGGLVWLPIESDSEADFLMNRIAHAVRDCRFGGFGSVPVVIALDGREPLAVWRRLFGTEVERGALVAATRAPAVLLLNGMQTVPPTFLSSNVWLLRHAMRSSRCIAVIPHFMSVRAELDKVGHIVDGDSIIDVPHFAYALPATQRRLAEQVVHRANRRHRRGGTADALHDAASRLLEAGPRSRDELVTWASYALAPLWPDLNDETRERGRATDVVEAVVEYLRNRPQHVPSHPPDHPDRERLAARYDRTRQLLAALDARLLNVGLPPLTRPIHDVPVCEHPFGAAEPAAWYLHLVSTLYRLIYDAGRRGLRVLDVYRFDAASRRLERRDEKLPRFVQIVNELRTACQHGLPVALGNSASTWARQGPGKEFVRLHCSGLESPPIEYARPIVAALLEEWEAYLKDVQGVVECLTGRGDIVVRDALVTANHGLGDNVAHAVIAEVNQAWGGLLGETGAFWKRHSQTIRKAADDSMLVGNPLRDFVRARVEACLVEQVLACPVNGPWLQQQGVTPGPRMAALINLAKKRWQFQLDAIRVDDPQTFLDRFAVEHQLAARPAGDPP